MQKSPDWFGDLSVPLNEDLVSIIGPRGSGKSALAELIAFAGGASVFKEPGDLSDSFLYKASRRSAANLNPITNTHVTLHWRDSSNDDITIPFPLKNTGKEVVSEKCVDA